MAREPIHPAALRRAPKKKPSLIDAINEAAKVSPYKTSLENLSAAEQAEVIGAAKHVVEHGISMRGAWPAVKERYSQLARTTWQTLIQKAKRGEL